MLNPGYVLAALFAALIPIFLFAGILAAVTGLAWLACRALFLRVSDHAKT